MIPENCRLDIYVDENNPRSLTKVLTILAKPPVEGNFTLIGSGYALNYKNLMMAAAPELATAWTSQLKEVEEVYVNQYPPEIQAQIDAEEAVEGWA